MANIVITNLKVLVDRNLYMNLMAQIHSTCEVKDYGSEWHRKKMRDISDRLISLVTSKQTSYKPSDTQATLASIDAATTARVARAPGVLWLVLL